MSQSGSFDFLLGNVGKVLLKTLGSALLVVLIGISSQTTLHGAVAVGIAGVMAAIASTLAAIQVFVPQVTFQKYLPGPLGAVLDAFGQAAVGAFITAAIGILKEPNFSAWHSLIIAALVGAVNAGARGVQAYLNRGEQPAQARGLELPASSAVLSF